MEGSENKTYKFDELLAKSQRLNTQLGSDFVGISQPLRLGVKELASSKSTVLGGQAVNELDNFTAAKFLAQRHFDAFGLSSEIRELEVEKPFSRSDKLDCADLDGYLSHHHDLIILTAIEDAKRSSQERERSIQRRWTVENWKVSRQRFLESIGHKSHHRSSSDYGDMLTNESGYQTGTKLGESVPFSLSGIQRHRTQVESVAQSQPVLPQLLENHISVVRSLNSILKVTPAISSSLTVSRASRVFSELADIATDAVSLTPSFGLSSSDLLGYRSMLQLLSSMVGECSKDFPTQSPAAFSAICLPQTEITSSITAAQAFQQLSLGAKRYFEERFNDKLRAYIEENTRLGKFEVERSDEGKGWQQRLRGCLGHLYSLGQLFDGDFDHSLCTSFCTNDSFGNSRVPLWAFIYYALSSGQILAAVDELSNLCKRGAGVLEKSALTILIFYEKLLSMDLSRFSSRDLEYQAQFSGDEVREFLRAMAFCREQCLSTDICVDPYKAHVLNLLSLCNRGELSNPEIPNYLIEDYLWSCIWFTVCNRLLRVVLDTFPQLQDAAIIVSSSRAMDGELQLYEEVLQYGGSNYFDPNRQSPFIYAMVLVCCCRIGEAIEYLWSSEKTLPAVHIAVAALHYGLILPHVPLEQNPSLHSLESQLLSKPHEGLSPASLFQFFFNNSFQQVFPEIALDYLMSLNSSWSAVLAGCTRRDAMERHEIRARAVVNSVLEEFLSGLHFDQLTKIVGSVPGEGPLVHGIILNYQGIDRDQLSLLLCRCAFAMRTTRHDSKRAVQFYKLGGRYADALDEICRQLSTVLALDESNEDRRYWMQEGRNFFELHVRNTQSAVLLFIQKDGRDDLIRCLQTLLELGTYFSLIRTRNWGEALATILRIQLIPKTLEDVAGILAPLHQLLMSGGPFVYVTNLLDQVSVSAIDVYQELIRAGNEEATVFRSQSAYQAGIINSMRSYQEGARALCLMASRAPAGIFRPETVAKLSKFELSLNL